MIRTIPAIKTACRVARVETSACRAELLESRTLLSGAYALHTLALFGGPPAGSYPAGTLAIDASRNLYGVAEYGGAYGDGTVFELARGSRAVTPVVSFDGADGGGPSDVVLAGGNLYGVTDAGGAGDDGTVFEIEGSSRHVTTLATFSSGQMPIGSIVLDPSGNIFGATHAGSASNAGTVFEVGKGSHAITTLASFHGTNGTPLGGLVLDTSGNIYGTTQIRNPDGADSGGTVFEILKGGHAATTRFSFDSGGPVNNVVLDAHGNLYGAATDAGALFEIPKGSDAVTLLASFNSSSSGQFPQGDVVFDASGNLFGTTETGGGSGKVFELARNSHAVTTLASFDSTNGPYPRDVVLDSSGDIYSSTPGSGPIQLGGIVEIAKGSRAITALASFNGPTGGENPYPVLSLDASGNLYGATVAGGAGNYGTAFEIAKGSNNIATLASFNSSTNPNTGYSGAGVLSDARGNLYGVTKGGAHGDGAVFELAKGSGVFTTLASFNGSNGSGPECLTLDASDNLYGVTAIGGASGDGTVFEIARGSRSITALASFKTSDIQIAAVSVDASGDVYGSIDLGGPAGKGSVYEVAKGSGVIKTLYSFGGAGTAGVGAVVLDAHGDLFGTAFNAGGSSGNGTVFEIANGSRALTTLASFTDASRGQGDLIAVDANGNLFGTNVFGASYDGTVFEVAKGSGTVTTLVAFNGANGDEPGGIVVDSNGNIYGTTASGGADAYGEVFQLTPISPPRHMR